MYSLLCWRWRRKPTLRWMEVQNESLCSLCFFFSETHPLIEFDENRPRNVKVEFWRWWMKVQNKLLCILCCFFSEASSMYKIWWKAVQGCGNWRLEVGIIYLVEDFTGFAPDKRHMTPLWRCGGGRGGRSHLGPYDTFGGYTELYMCARFGKNRFSSFWVYKGQKILCKYIQLPTILYNSID